MLVGKWALAILNIKSYILFNGEWIVFNFFPCFLSMCQFCLVKDISISMVQNFVLNKPKEQCCMDDYNLTSLKGWEREMIIKDLCAIFFCIYYLFLFFFLNFHFLLQCGTCRILVPWPEIKPAPLQLKCRILTSGLPRKSLYYLI